MTLCVSSLGLVPLLEARTASAENNDNMLVENKAAKNNTASVQTIQ